MNDCKISVHCSQTALLSWRNVHLFINHTLFILNIIILFKNSISLCFHGNSAVSVWMGDQEREKDGVTKAQMVKLSPKLKISRHHMMSRLTGINEWCERLISAADVPENTSHDESFNIWTSPPVHMTTHTNTHLYNWTHNPTARASTQHPHVSEHLVLNMICHKECSYITTNTMQHISTCDSSAGEVSYG